jgi:dCMP deaminase
MVICSTQGGIISIGRNTVKVMILWNIESLQRKNLKNRTRNMSESLKALLTRLGTKSDPLEQAKAAYKQQELDGVYMGVALLHAQLSKAKRKQVGACLVTESGVIVPGYNGTVKGTDNSCEILLESGELQTKDSTLHAELNAILKCSLEGISTKNSTLYVTLSPCLRCSSMLAQAGIKRVVYGERYRDNSGVDFLLDCGIDVN